MAKRPRVIADAGPLIALAKLNVLPLLKRLYGRVIIFAQIEQREDIWISAELCQQVLAEVRKEQRRRGREKKP